MSFTLSISLRILVTEMSTTIRKEKRSRAHCYEIFCLSILKTSNILIEKLNNNIYLTAIGFSPGGSRF